MILLAKTICCLSLRHVRPIPPSFVLVQIWFYGVSLGMQSAFLTNFFIIVSSFVSVILLFSTTHMPYSITVLAKSLVRWVFWEVVTLQLARLFKILLNFLSAALMCVL